MTEKKIWKLKGGNFDLDLWSSEKVSWKQDPCPWNEQDGTLLHRCAVKNTSICQFFIGLGGTDEIDTVQCSYPFTSEPS